VKLFASFLSLFICHFSFAISEINYESEYKAKIIPLINAYESNFFIGEKGIKINYALYTSNPSSQRCLVILPGRTEAIEKYAEVIYDLDQSELAGQFTYFLMDHRGQGSSERMITKKPIDLEKGHVDKFKNYTKDVKTFMDKVVAGKNCSDVSLLAHSLGAGIATHFLQKHPEYFDRAVLSSPMLKIQTKPYKYALAKTIVVANIILGRAKKFTIGASGFNPERDFDGNTFTSSPERFEMAMNMFDLIPKARLGGVTNNWVNQIMKGTRLIRKRYDMIQIPLVVIHAGFETYSEPSEMIRLCDEAADCERLYLESSKHEVFMDRDINRDQAVRILKESLL
tara:strand:+ start:164 stop:1183 length:1020 start_codon:yes stop_codon:yes gene_type:complete